MVSVYRSVGINIGKDCIICVRVTHVAAVVTRHSAANIAFVVSGNSIFENTVGLFCASMVIVQCSYIASKLCLWSLFA